MDHGKYQLENSEEVIYRIHYSGDCFPDPCPIHNKSDHHMRSWPQHWRADRRIMERICPHGVGHPDPDERADINTEHGCDGCCVPPGEEK